MNYLGLLKDCKINQFPTFYKKVRINRLYPSLSLRVSVCSEAWESVFLISESESHSVVSDSRTSDNSYQGSLANTGINCLMCCGPIKIPPGIFLGVLISFSFITELGNKILSK